MKQFLILLSIVAAVSAFAPNYASQQQSKGSSVLNMKLSQDDKSSNRRQALSTIFGGVIAASSSSLSPTIVNALDMDAFMNAELANDTKNCDPKRDPKCAPQMSSDEATCKYGQGKAKVEACKRLREAGKDIPKENGGKSLGGAYAM